MCKTIERGKKKKEVSLPSLNIRQYSSVFRSHVFMITEMKYSIISKIARWNNRVRCLPFYPVRYLAWKSLMKRRIFLITLLCINISINEWRPVNFGLEPSRGGLFLSPLPCVLCWYFHRVFAMQPLLSAAPWALSPLRHDLSLYSR